MQHLGTQRLETSRLILRKFTEMDAEPMYRNWASDPCVTKYLTWAPHESVEVTRNLMRIWSVGYQEATNYQWAIEEKSSQEVIGSISVVDFSDPKGTASIGYCIGRAYWGKGITAEALWEVIRFLFEEVGFVCVNACHDPRNPNSGRVMEKCGMRKEGVRRRAGLNQMGVCDECWHSILREEYEAMKEKRAGEEVVQG